MSELTRHHKYSSLIAFGLMSSDESFDVRWKKGCSIRNRIIFELHGFLQTNFEQQENSLEPFVVIPTADQRVERNAKVRSTLERKGKT